MDFQVEATVRLNNFPNKAQVQEILRSHDLEMIPLTRDQVRVKGWFLNLKAAKASLEPLLHSQTKRDIASTSSSPVLEVSSGAVSKHYTKTDGARGRSGSRNKPPHASPSSPTFPSPLASRSSNNRPIFPECRASVSQSGSLRPGKESFVIDADVFEYATQLRKKDIDNILESHNVIMQECQVIEDSYDITLHGKGAKIAVGKLQSLLENLRISLRTQEVLLEDMDHKGRALLEKIRKSKNIYNAVLVCPKTDKLHLIGSSSGSYELKQRLLGRSVDRSGRTGRTQDRTTKQRSSSLPPINGRNTDRHTGAISNPSAGAAGYSASKYQDVKQKDVEPKRGAAARSDPVFRRRSQSESRKKTQAERTHGYEQDTESKLKPAKPPKNGFMKLLTQVSPENVKQKFKSIRKKR